MKSDDPAGAANGPLTGPLADRAAGGRDSDDDDDMAKPRRTRPIGDHTLSRDDAALVMEFPASRRQEVAAGIAELYQYRDHVLADRWRAYRSKQRDRARAGVETRQDERARAADLLRTSVRSLRARHPDWGVRALARELLRRGRIAPTDKRLNAMAARIRRLL
jgi:hypothetical protein